jgi:hypothetical protein
MFKKIIFISLFVFLLGGFMYPKAEAIDPVTMSLLAPYAMPVAEAAAQYALRGLVNTIPGFIEIGKDMLSIFLLPLGLIESTVGAPFGFLGPGINHLISGFEAPFLLVFDVLFLPVAAMGFRSPNG